MRRPMQEPHFNGGTSAPVTLQASPGWQRTSRSPTTLPAGSEWTTAGSSWMRRGICRFPRQDFLSTRNGTAARIPGALSGHSRPNQLPGQVRSRKTDLETRSRNPVSVTRVRGAIRAVPVARHPAARGGAMWPHRRILNEFAVSIGSSMRGWYKYAHGNRSPLDTRVLHDMVSRKAPVNSPFVSCRQESGRWR